MTLERATIIRQNQLEEMRLKLFILEEQKRQYEEYSIYLEETLSTYRAEEKIFAETKLNFLDGTSETEENEKKNEDDTLAPALIDKNNTYWKCFWCLTERGQNGRCSQDYTAHLKRCFKKKIFENCYQNELIKCNACYGVKVVFQSSLNKNSETCAFCSLCRTLLGYKNNNSLSKHMKGHQKSFSFLCSCTNNFVFDVWSCENKGKITLKFVVHASITTQSFPYCQSDFHTNSDRTL